MDASFIKKRFGIFKYIFSSMTTIELFIFSLLLFTLLIVNLSRKEKIINIGFIGIYLGLFLGIFVSYFDYVRLCFRLLTKSIMKYYYFPSTIVYFFIVLFSIIMILYSIFKKKLVKWKKIFNYAVFNINNPITKPSIGSFISKPMLDTTTLIKITIEEYMSVF